MGWHEVSVAIDNFKYILLKKLSNITELLFVLKYVVNNKSASIQLRVVKQASNLSTSLD